MLNVFAFFSYSDLKVMFLYYSLGEFWWVLKLQRKTVNKQQPKLADKEGVILKLWVRWVSLDKQHSEKATPG